MTMGYPLRPHLAVSVALDTTENERGGFRLPISLASDAEIDAGNADANAPPGTLVVVAVVIVLIHSGPMTVPRAVAMRIISPVASGRATRNDATVGPLVLHDCGGRGGGCIYNVGIVLLLKSDRCDIGRGG